MAAGIDGGVRPILKWAGGKRQLLPSLRPYYPPMFRRYFEPFVGSGAVFLDLHNQGRLERRAAYLSDTNADVIGCYRAVRDDAEAVIAELEALERGHLAGGKDHFYEVRDARFNPTRRALGDEPAGSARAYPPALAAMLIYLNRTGYNGLFRVNADGGFNVPAGRYGKVRICDAANIRAVSRALGRPGVHLDTRAFEDALSAAGRRDFVYLDPPYAPLSPTAQFTAYTADGFGAEQQAALQKTVLGLAARGAQVLLSNSVAADIRALYEDSLEAQSAGFKAIRVRARRAINSNASRRSGVLEYVITNVGPPEVV
jgi:DNA adenine methylase